MKNIQKMLLIGLFTLSSFVMASNNAPKTHIQPPKNTPASRIKRDSRIINQWRSLLDARDLRGIQKAVNDYSGSDIFDKSYHYSSEEILTLTDLILCRHELKPSHIPILQFLVDKGMPINKRDSAGLTPLCWSHPFKITEFLIQHGADVNFRASDGTTPLRESILKSSPETAALLLYHGAVLSNEDAQFIIDTTGRQPNISTRTEQRRLLRSIRQKEPITVAPEYNERLFEIAEKQGRTIIHTIDTDELKKALYAQHEINQLLRGEQTTRAQEHTPAALADRKEQKSTAIVAQEEAMAAQQAAAVEMPATPHTTAQGASNIDDAMANVARRSTRENYKTMSRSLKEELVRRQLKLSAQEYQACLAQDRHTQNPMLDEFGRPIKKRIKDTQRYHAHIAKKQPNILINAVRTNNLTLIEYIVASQIFEIHENDANGKNAYDYAIEMNNKGYPFPKQMLDIARLQKHIELNAKKRTRKEIRTRKQILAMQQARLQEALDERWNTNKPHYTLRNTKSDADVDMKKAQHNH